MGAEKHPKGLYVLFFTEMWERFGFYSMLSMFVLYLRDDRQGFGWSADEAVKLLSTYLMCVYASPLVGGWIANRKLGYRNSVLIGGLIFMVGYFLFTIHAEAAVYAALVCLVIGNGFFKPNVSAMVGDLYPDASPLKDRAYNIFYMGINIGALLAPINAEIMVHWIGYPAAFAVAAVGMIVSVNTLWSFRAYVGGAAPHTAPTPEVAASPAVRHPIETVSDARRVGALIVIFLIVIVFWMVFNQAGSTLTFFADENIRWNVSGIISNAINPFFVVALTFPVIWMWNWLHPRGLEPSIPMKMAIGMLLTTAAFTILYLAAKDGEAVAVQPDMYATGDFLINDRCLEKLKAGGVPEAVIEKLQAKDQDGKFLIKDKKFATDEKSSGEHKLTEALAKELGEDQAARYGPDILKQSFLFKVSPLWLILAYAVLTLGELMLSPMGLALVAKVAPARLRGVMMGGWFLATALGGLLTRIGVYYSRWDQSSFFAMLGLMALVIAGVLMLLLLPLKKAMPGV
jgi:POT family proton-dependent oligopeptide transporter